MTNRQFSFSLSVGIALTVLGVVIISKAAVGFSLIALGFAIAALAMLTRKAQGEEKEPIAVAATEH